MTSSLKGRTVAFTGFRDKALQEKITAKGGRVVSSVSPQTDVLVASGSKGVQSAKAVTARKLGTRVMSRDEFEAEFFPPSLLDRVLGKGDKRQQQQQCYFTHDNGGRPFKVCFNGHSFWVFTPSNQVDDDDEVHDAVAVKPTKHARAFIGRSPLNAMTEFSGGHGPKFDGNSMMFELAPNRYMFIGECIRVFDTRSPIAAFVSHVGNSDVPYPFAVDRDGGIYLMIEGVRLTAGPYPTKVLQDPYTFYYARCLLTPDMSMAEAAEPVLPFEGITKFYIGSKQYTFSYEPRPAEGFDRRSRFGSDKTRITPLHVIAHGEKKMLLKKDYVGLMRRVGAQRGFAPFKSKVIVPRL